MQGIKACISEREIRIDETCMRKTWIAQIYD